MRLVEEKEAVAGLSLWGLVCIFDLGSMWPELDAEGARWFGAGALAVFIASTVLLLAQCLQPRPTSARRQFLKRPLSMAAHTLLISGCGIWLTVRVAIGGSTAKVYAGIVALWALLNLFFIRACDVPIDPANARQSGLHTCTFTVGEPTMLMPFQAEQAQSKAVLRPEFRVEPLPPESLPVLLPGVADSRRTPLRKSKSMGASLKDLFNGPWQLRESDSCLADDDRASILAHMRQGSQRDGDDAGGGSALAKGMPSQAEPRTPPSDECEEVPPMTMPVLQKRLASHEDSHEPKQGISRNLVDQPISGVRRISVSIPGSKNAPPLLAVPESTEASTKIVPFEQASGSSSPDSQVAQQSCNLALGIVSEMARLKAPDVRESEKKLAEECHVMDGTGLVEAESLRKATLANLCRRPVRIGDPISGARVEELHEILVRESDVAWLSSCGELNWYAFASFGDPEALDTRQESLNLEFESNGVKIDESMGNDDFQRLRDRFQTIEAAKSANKTPSMLPIMLHSFSVSRMSSRRGSCLPGLSGQAADFKSGKSSAIGSRRLTRNASRCMSRDSLCVPEAISAAGSRRASAIGDDYTSVVTSPTRRESMAKLATTSRRNSLMLPLGAKFFDEDEKGDKIEDEDKIEWDNRRVDHKRSADRRGTAPTLTMSVPQAKSFDKWTPHTSTAMAGQASDLKPERKDDANPWRREVCACGNIFMDDSVFCRKCGEKRPVEVPDDKKIAIDGSSTQSSLLQIPTASSKIEEAPSEEEHSSEQEQAQEQEVPFEIATDGDAKAERLRTALVNQPQMRLKDFLLEDGDFGELSVECLLRVASDFSKSHDQAFDPIQEEEGEESDHEDWEDGKSEFSDDSDDSSDKDPIFEGQLKGVKMDPSVVSEALKLLMLLNDGFKSKHCTCKQGGPHTCMSPAVSQLASQVHTTLQSLNQSMTASKVVSVVGSRRGSSEAEVRRRRSSKESKDASISQLSMSIQEDESMELPPPPPPFATKTRLSLMGSRGRRPCGKVDFTDTNYGPADVGAGPSSSSSPTHQAEA